MTRPLLILDLDETLLHSREEPLERPADLRVGAYHTYARPHLSQFLARVRQSFELAVWTAATRDYASYLVGHLFPADLELAFFFSRERCTLRRDPETFEGHYLKDLKKVRRLGYDLKRAVMLDDNPRALARHYGNLLRAPAYTGQAEDDGLLRALAALERLLEHDNFRTVDKGRLWSAPASATERG